jgi:hypothetical protein
MTVVKPIQLRRNTKAYGLALTDGMLGEIFVCTDVPEILVGTGSGFQALRAAAYPAPWSTSRSTVSHTTASLAADASEDASLTVPKSYGILHVSTNYPARVRLYLSSAQRTADAARDELTDPEGDHGCILEVITTGSVLALDLSPVAFGICPTGTTAYLTVKNKDTVSRAITVSLSVLELEDA